VSNTTRSAVVRTIVGAATQLPPEAREAYVRDAAGADEQLFGELMSLLNADSASKFFSKAAVLLADGQVESVPTAGAVSNRSGAPRRSASADVLAEGTRLGPYEIVAPIGFGGMGEVYRARDLLLHRDVAIKVLPAALATQEPLVERLRREAKLLAALNHRNVAAIYGLHEADGVLGLVLELVEGKTLAERISEGPLPLVEALSIARQIADALEAAHEKGIIHRDLKPENVKIRPDGEVKVLDFGIAKALHDGAEGDLSAIDLSAASLTGTGGVIGTPSYMSPEQIRGLAVDRRSDLWAFGLVLWEMITGKQPFAGDTVLDRMASTLAADADWAQLPAHIPPALRRLLSRTLEKERRLRLDSAAVARLEIEEALSAPPLPSRPVTALRVAPWVIAAGCLAALGVTTWRARTLQPPPPTPAHVSTELGAEIALREDLGPAAVLSPDGQSVVFSSRETDVPPMLYIRRLDQLVAAPLSSTEDATSPFFSPDGKWIAFFAERKLKRISASGGVATTITDAPNGRGGTWGTDDVIVFAGGNPAPYLVRVTASGGLPEPVTTLLKGELSHRWPQLLPQNRAVLYTSNTSNNWDDARVMIQPLPTGTPKVVQEGFFGRYVASGHLLYLRTGTLYAAPFDAERLEVTGPSAVVIEDVAADASTGGGQFSVSDSGMLAYLQGHGESPGAPAVWMDRGGNTMPLRAKRAEWGSPQFSPDGKHLAFDVSDGKQVDIWVQDLATGQVSRLTFDGADDFKPVWSPDGRWIAFASTRNGVANLFRMRSDGVGDAQRLTHSPNPQSPASWHPSGRFLAFEETRAGTGLDIMTLPLPDESGPIFSPGAPTVLVAGPTGDAEPVFSPDGRYLAYRSNETGRVEIFVRAFAGPRGTWQVSNGGGRDAAWSRRSAELLYFDTAQDRIMVASYAVSDGSFRADSPRPWSIIRVGRPPARTGRMFDVHPDGERVVVAPAESQKADHMMLIFDFFAHLARVAPGADGTPR
jgi:serine/threonine protein kinase